MHVQASRLLPFLQLLLTSKLTSVPLATRLDYNISQVFVSAVHMYVSVCVSCSIFFSILLPSVGVAF